VSAPELSDAVVNKALANGFGWVMLHGGIGVWIMAAISFLIFNARAVGGQRFSVRSEPHRSSLSFACAATGCATCGGRSLPPQRRDAYRRNALARDLDVIASRLGIA
jgi:hypothetical protein